MAVKLSRLYEDLKKDGIFFCFSGAINQNTVEGIGETLKQKMALEAMGMGTIQKVFGILVEQMQNIINYSAEKIQGGGEGAELSVGILTVGREGGRICIRCGNYIGRDKAPIMSERISKLQTMSKEELKSYYKERRKAGPEEGSKGAGLGFIEMARSAAMPIEFEIEDVNDKQAFFSLKVMIAE